MSKSKEELNAIKEEVETVNEKLSELTEEEIKQVCGGLAKIKLVKDKYGSRIENYELVPVICHRELGLSKIKVYKLGNYTDDLADKNDIKAKKILADGPLQTAKTRLNITIT